METPEAAWVAHVEERLSDQDRRIDGLEGQVAGLKCELLSANARLAKTDGLRLLPEYRHLLFSDGTGFMWCLGRPPTSIRWAPISRRPDPSRLASEPT